jgi:excisionase family DNA binding protein
MNDHEKPMKQVVPEHLPYKEVFNFDEVAFLIGFSRRKVEELVASKELATVAPGRVSRTQLDHWVHARELEATLLSVPKRPITRPKRRNRSLLQRST